MSNELDNRQQVAAPTSEGQGNAASPGKGTLLDGLSSLGAAVNPFSAGVAAGRYVGSVFANHGATTAPTAPAGTGGAAAAASGAGSATAQPTMAITAPPGSPTNRVQTAAAANNVPLVAQIQTELVAQQPRTPEISEAIATARHWLMDQVAAIRDRHTAELEAAQHASAAGSAEAAGPPAAGGFGPVETIEVRIDAECAPYLTALLHGDPQFRYEHFNQDITAKVFSAVRLHAARQGVSRIGHRREAETDARATGHLSAGEWCGAFAFAQQNEAGGMSAAWASNMQSEHAIRDSLNYRTASKWIWTGDTWQSIRAYHASRGSVRYYHLVEPGQPVPQIEPGDIVLKDVTRGTDPDHITSAITSDGRHLQTIGGNEGGSGLNDETGVARTQGSIDLQTQPGPNDTRRRDENGRPIPETNDPSLHKNSRVHGVGRWSIVDYEEHTYSSAPIMPTAPPGGTQQHPPGH